MQQEAGLKERAPWRAPSFQGLYAVADFIDL
jgi:hypothetical protein